MPAGLPCCTCALSRCPSRSPGRFGRASACAPRPQRAKGCAAAPVSLEGRRRALGTTPPSHRRARPGPPLTTCAWLCGLVCPCCVCLCTATATAAAVAAAAAAAAALLPAAACRAVRLGKAV
eukprot:363996-Chlamydomonas_euryale.AAC.7